MRIFRVNIRPALATISILLVSLVIKSCASSSPNKVMIISDFSSRKPREMETIDDPVMGGTSFSTAEQKDDCLVWEGEVHIVSFLGSPGFCILETAGRQDFTGLGDTRGISFLVDATKSNMLLPLAAQVTTGARSSEGYPVTYVGVLNQRATTRHDHDDGRLVELYAPWTAFKPNFRGQDVDAPPLTSQELEKTYRIGLSTYQSHKAGAFHVELVKIEALISDESTS